MNGSDEGQPGDPGALYHAIRTEVDQVLVGNDEAVEHLTIALLTRGHVLLEGVPGVAKTTIANLFARVCGLEYRRIQMTPDILPADITGTHVYRENVGEFELQRGPVFSNLIVADEINRATPKTQSALLEAMQERTVTIEGETLALPTPFMVVATQNPIEMEGVFELPEAQRDRFQLKLAIALPDRTDERTLLDHFDEEPELGPDDVDQVLDAGAILRAQDAVADVHVTPPIKEYVLDLVRETRTHPDVAHGASPRASLAFLQASKARAAIHGRNYVIPDDAKALAEPVLVHRLVLDTEADLGGVSPSDVIEGIVSGIEPPGADVQDVPAVSDGGRESEDSDDGQSDEIDDGQEGVDESSDEPVDTDDGGEQDGTDGGDDEPVETDGNSDEPVETDGNSDEPVETDEDGDEPVDTDEDGDEPVDTDVDADEPVDTDVDADERVIDGEHAEGEHDGVDEDNDEGGWRWW